MYQQGDFQQSKGGLERCYELALQSWKVGDVLPKPASANGTSLALSSNTSSIDLKDFLSRRGTCIVTTTAVVSWLLWLLSNLLM
jgi:hypothetical protein